PVDPLRCILPAPTQGGPPCAFTPPTRCSPGDNSTTAPPSPPSATSSTPFLTNPCSTACAPPAAMATTTTPSSVCRASFSSPSCSVTSRSATAWRNCTATPPCVAC